MKISASSPQILSTLEQASIAVKRSIDETDDLSEDQKQKVKEAIDKTVVPSAEVPNTFVYWIAVGALAALAFLIVLGGLYLSAVGNDTPNFLQMTLATAVGALAGMIVPTPKTGL